MAAEPDGDDASATIDLDAIKWRKVGEDFGDAASLLKATIKIGGTLFHIEAIAVRHVSRVGATVQMGCTSETDYTLSELYSLVAADGCLACITVNGQDYVAYATPYCR